MKNKNSRYINGLLVVVISMLFLNTSCYKEEIIPETIAGEGLADWTAETHSGSAFPDYDIVFPQDQVNRIDIIISSGNWETLMDDLEENLGSSSSGGGPFGGGVSTDDYTPVFVPCSFNFNETEWYNVGFRFKGNSSLKLTYQNGLKKLAFRIDFDEFEDEYPEINDQRFYGFQKLAFSSNYKDASFLHEKIAADIFRDAGLKAPRTAYYRVYVDYGEGPIYFGLYTTVEIVEDTMLDDQFGNSSGNCYKPEYDAATFAYGTFNTSEFDLKTNEDIADYSDVEALYDVLHSSNRTSNVDQWKSDLESVFDVDNFMLWLAANTTIQNWDTYGAMNHNYYLYNNAYTNKLVWIPWDNNEALCEGKRGNLSFSMEEVTSDWPLISYLINISEYEEKYENYLLEVINDAFEPSKVQATYQYYHDLISDYVIGTDGEQPGYTFLESSSEFTNALYEQFDHVEERYDAVIDYLSK